MFQNLSLSMSSGITVRQRALVSHVSDFFSITGRAMRLAIVFVFLVFPYGESSAKADELAERFIGAMLYSGLGTNVSDKPFVFHQRSINIHIIGEEDAEPPFYQSWEIREFLRNLSSVTGHGVSLVERLSEANVIIVATNSGWWIDEYWLILEAIDGNREGWSGLHRFVFDPKGGEVDAVTLPRFFPSEMTARPDINEVAIAVSLVNPAAPNAEVLFARAILLSMGYGLNFGYDGGPASLFRNDATNANLTEVDRLFLKILYEEIMRENTPKRDILEKYAETISVLSKQ